MDGSRFDDLARALGAGRTRRGALGLMAALAAGGLAAGGAEAKRKCRKDSPAGQCCKKRDGVVTCSCKDGGTVCGANCCRIGQACDDGQCVHEPEPATCIELGEACKNVGRPCCENLQCGSGQGGGDIACWVRKTGRCASTAECVYGTECVDGICVGLPQPEPTPTCDAQLGQVCVVGTTVCCAGSCGPVNGGNGAGFRIAQTLRCCVPETQSCTNGDQCCCPNGGASTCDSNNKCVCNP